jgi:cytidyltransferase-like protein
MRILVMGLPGSGKTTLATVLAEKLSATYFNADEVRKMFNDWDFSDAGRERQAHRMRDLCDMSDTQHTVADFICPTEQTREIFSPEFVVFMNTIDTGRFEDTNRVFEAPEKVDVLVNGWMDPNTQADIIIEQIKKMPVYFEWKRPTGLMIGRFQPFHDGHLKLFETIMEKEGQVLIGVRDTYNTDEKNPFDFWQVYERISTVLDEKYAGRYEILQLPNITGVYYGRDVGYNVEQIHLDSATDAISATDIRRQLGM